MSEPVPYDQTPLPGEPRIGLLVTVVEHLLPLFKTGLTSTNLARRRANSAIGAYFPESGADFVNIARTVGFSIAALALLGKAATQDLTLAEQMRVFGRANALNRSADQSEQIMIRRRRDQRANPPVDLPDTVDETPPPPPPPPAANVDEARIEARIAEMMRQHVARQSAGAPPERPPQPPRAPAPAPAPVPAQTPTPAPVPAAAQTRRAVLGPDAAPPARSAPYRDALLRQTAIQRVIGQTGTRPPG